MLFIPSGWWHTTMMLMPSISLPCNAGNSWNWGAMRRDLTVKGSRRNNRKAEVYLRLAGLSCSLQDWMAGFE